MRKFLLAVGALVILIAGASELEARKSKKKMQDVVVSGYIKPTLRGAKVGVGYITIENKREGDITLKSAGSDIAGRVELHDHTMSPEGLMQMIEIKDLKIPAGGSLAMAPGGKHLMLFELEGAINVGDKAKFTFNFDLGNEETHTVKTTLTAKK